MKLLSGSNSKEEEAAECGGRGGYAKYGIKLLMMNAALEAVAVSLGVILHLLGSKFKMDRVGNEITFFTSSVKKKVRGEWGEVHIELTKVGRQGEGIPRLCFPFLLALTFSFPSPASLCTPISSLSLPFNHFSLPFLSKSIFPLTPSLLLQACLPPSLPPLSYSHSLLPFFYKPIFLYSSLSFPHSFTFLCRPTSMFPFSSYSLFPFYFKPTLPYSSLSLSLSLTPSSLL